MAMTDNVRPAPFGAITIYRVIDAADRFVTGLMQRRGPIPLGAFSPAEREDLGLPVAGTHDGASARTGRLARLAAAIRDRRQAARTAAELSRLKPELLADIGLTEADVAAMSRAARLF